MRVLSVVVDGVSITYLLLRTVIFVVKWRIYTPLPRCNAGTPRHTVSDVKSRVVYIIDFSDADARNADYYPVAVCDPNPDPLPGHGRRRGHDPVHRAACQKQSVSSFYWPVALQQGSWCG